MKIIEVSSYRPRAAAVPALPRAKLDPGAARDGEAASGLVLTTPRPTGALPFLAQYLAQEFVGADSLQPRWRDRDNAYRLASTPTTRAQLTLDV